MIKELVEKLITYIRSLYGIKKITYPSAEIKNRQRVQTLLDYYQGNQLDYLDVEISKQFRNPSALKMQLSVSNIVRFITDTVCNSFKNGVRVTANNKNDQPILDKILKDVSFDSFLRLLEQTTFLCKTAFVKVGWKDTNQITLDIITPQYVNVNTTDLLELSEIVYPYKLMNFSVTEPIGTFNYWTPTTYKRIDQNGTTILVPENPDNTNPYGIIPIVTFRERQSLDGSYILWGGEELVNSQNTLNILLTSLNQLIKMQSFAQPVIKNPPTNKYTGVVDIVIDPSKPIVFEGGDKDTPGSFEFVSPDAKIAELQEVIDATYIRIFSFFGLNAASFVASAERMSGEGIKESSAKINEYREAVRLVFAPQIEKLIEVIKIVWNTHNEQEKLSDDGIQLEILQSSVSGLSVDDTIKTREWKLKNNMATLIDFMIEDTDNLDEQTAKDKLEKNKQINEQYNIADNLPSASNDSIG
ncbi:MAG: phage portal protein [Candidatus Paceibacterota bacterium]|jgi:hypothetical protein